MSTDGEQEHSKALENTSRNTFSTLFSTLDFPAATSAVQRQHSFSNNVPPSEKADFSEAIMVNECIGDLALIQVP